MNTSEAAAFRVGLEAAARIVEQPPCPDTRQDVAAAIRALPVPESSEATAADWAERYRLVCFELCERMGIKPDEIIADSGEEAWMLAGYEATTKQTAAALRAARGQP